MRFLGGLFESKVNATGVISRATAGSLVARARQYALMGDWDIERAVKDGYERVMMVFRCVDAIAAAQADIPIVVRRGDMYDGELVEYESIDRLLNDMPNDYEDAWQLRYRLSSQLLLSRRGAFIEMVPNILGGTAQIHLLPPGEVRPIPGEVPTPEEFAAGKRQKFVDGYEITRADGVVEEIPPERVIWIKAKTHPTDPYMQMTPLVAAGLAVETDFLARLFNRNFLMNDGRPGMLVTIQGQLNHEDASEVKRRFSGGYAAAGQTTVIEADGLQVEDLAANPRDVQWAEAVRGSDEDIRTAFGCPESVLGNASGRTFDNADAEFEMWHQVTVKQHCNAITRPLSKRLIPQPSKDKIVHDFSKVEVLQRFEQKRRDLAATRFGQGLATLDQYLIESGQQPMNLPASRVYFLPNGLVVGADPDVKAVQEMKPVGLQAAPDPTESARRGALMGSRQGQRNFENIIAARAMRVAKTITPETEVKSLDAGPAHPYAEDRAMLEGAVEGVLSGWTDRQEKVISERLSHAKVRKGTRHWDGEQKGVELKVIDPLYVVELEKWSNEVRDTLNNILLKTALREARRVAADMDAKGLVKLLEADGKTSSGNTPLTKLMGGTSGAQAMIDNTLAPILDLIEKAASNQSRRIIDAIKEMDGDGASLTEIKGRVREMMSTRSSWHKQLSINVATSTMEGVRDAVYSSAGSYIEKTWQANRDEKTRPSHWKANGQTRKAQNAFKVGGVSMQRPGDPTAPIHEVANCRCWLDWKISESAIARRNRTA
jgi:HK97 family phage portal protein